MLGRARKKEENDRTKESDVYGGSQVSNEWRKKDARGRWKRTGSSRSDKDRRQTGSKVRTAKKQKKGEKK